MSDATQPKKGIDWVFATVIILAGLLAAGVLMWASQLPDGLAD